MSKSISLREFLIVVACAIGFAIGVAILLPTIAQIAPGAPPPRRSVEVGIVASTIQTQGQRPLTAGVNIIATVANDGDVVTAPPCLVGFELTVVNGGANTLQIFPESSGGGQTLGRGLNIAYEIEPGYRFNVVCRDGTTWTILDEAGNWTDIPHNAGDFTGNGSMTWTVEAGDLLDFRYMVLGGTMFLTWNIDNSSVGGTLNNVLQLAIPGGYVVDGTAMAMYRIRESGAFTHGRTNIVDGNAFLSLQQFDNGDWAMATNATDVEGQAFFPVVVP